MLDYRTHAHPLKIGILSDTHGEIDPRILTHVADCDIKIHAGDIMGKSILDALEASGGDIIAVKGNNDLPATWGAADRHAVQSLPQQALVRLPGGDVVVVHGHLHGGNHISHQHLRECFPEVRLIVYGHSHHLVHDQETTPWVMNPGAAGKTRTHGGPSCIILHIKSEQWHIQTIREPEPLTSGFA